MSDVMEKLTLLMEHANITQAAAEKAQDEYRAALVAAASFKVGDIVTTPNGKKTYRICQIDPMRFRQDVQPNINDDAYYVHGQLLRKDGTFGVVHNITYGWVRSNGGAA